MNKLRETCNQNFICNDFWQKSFLSVVWKYIWQLQLKQMETLPFGNGTSFFVKIYQGKIKNRKQVFFLTGPTGVEFSFKAWKFTFQNYFIKPEWYLEIDLFCSTIRNELLNSLFPFLIIPWISIVNGNLEINSWMLKCLFLRITCLFEEIFFWTRLWFIPSILKSLCTARVWYTI